MAKRLVFFNHKGGVSKTTSVYNIGWMLAKNSRVLLVDADSQCNLTSLLLRDSFEQYYVDRDTKTQNIKDGVSPAFEGRPVPIDAVQCFHPERANELYLLAGHANLSEYDAALTFAQTSNNALSTLQNLPGAFAQLLQLTEQRYGIDFTLIDMNPSLSSINQNLFLISDGFIIPTNPDPFSIMALGTLRSVLPRWATWKAGAVEAFATSAYPMPPGQPKFIGTLIQRFNIRNGRAARPYRDNIDEIKQSVRDNLVEALRPAGMTLAPNEYGREIREADYCLSEIPDFQGLLPKAHDVGVPVYEMTDREINETGPILTGLKQKRDMFRDQFSELSSKIARLLGHA